jgi:hypothetical protein
VVRWTGRGRRTARMRTKTAIAVTAPSTDDKATATTVTAVISRRVVIVGSRMAQSLEHPSLIHATAQRGPQLVFILGEWGVSGLAGRTSDNKSYVTFATTDVVAPAKAEGCRPGAGTPGPVSVASTMPCLSDGPGGGWGNSPPLVRDFREAVTMPGKQR